MEITQKSAKEIVRDLEKFEREIKGNFKGNEYSTEYLIYLKRNLMNLTLDKKDSKNYRLTTMRVATNPICDYKSELHTRNLLYFLLEISNSIEINGLVQTDRIAYDLFNVIFREY